MYTQTPDLDFDTPSFTHIIDTSSTLIAVLILALMFGLTSTAQAQSEEEVLATATDEETPAKVEVAPPANALGIASTAWRTHFGDQMAHVLRGPAGEATDIALHNLVVVAAQDRNGIDLSSTVGGLLDICASDASAARRLMAIQTLNVIGTDHASTMLYRRAMEQLYRIVQDEPPGRVHQAAVATLNNFYTAEAKGQ